MAKPKHVNYTCTNVHMHVLDHIIAKAEGVFRVNWVFLHACNVNRISLQIYRLQIYIFLLYFLCMHSLCTHPTQTPLSLHDDDQHDHSDRGDHDE